MNSGSKLLTCIQVIQVTEGNAQNQKILVNNHYSNIFCGWQITFNGGQSLYQLLSFSEGITRMLIVVEDHLFNLTELTRQNITVIMQASHIKTFRQISQDGQMGRIKM